MVSVFSALALVLSARLLLLLTLVGAFVLGWAAMREQTYLALGVMIAYTVLTVIPMVSLEMRGHK
jgi:hypothetical protein